MITVRRPDISDQQWQEWRTQTSAAMQELIAAYKPGDDVKIKDEFYKRAMPFLLRLFNEKCAYCESAISLSQPGDVEHYRPKGRIRDENGKVLRVKLNDAEIEHPGYWWLAYDWRNLLPSCADCNRERYHGGETTYGKSDYFRVRGRRAVVPKDDLSEEQALLLNPTEDSFDPAVHMKFQPDGKIKPLTEEASYTCELLGLNERSEMLTKARQDIYVAALEAISNFLLRAATMPRDQLASGRKRINDMWEGRGPYSAFARQALQDAIIALEQNTGSRLRLPLT